LSSSDDPNLLNHEHFIIRELNEESKEYIKIKFDELVAKNGIV